jgi:hypothetical protein
MLIPYEKLKRETTNSHLHTENTEFGLRPVVVQRGRQGEGQDLASVSWVDDTVYTHKQGQGSENGEAARWSEGTQTIPKTSRSVVTRAFFIVLLFDLQGERKVSRTGKGRREEKRREEKRETNRSSKLVFFFDGHLLALQIENAEQETGVSVAVK